ncbi:MAG: phosphohydrolase, partial [Flavobacteriales bacterium]|nr:phosphohydrolase [Flavobacteriales bacterium]
YWQVYLHKTVLSAEFMLVNILKRAKELSSRGVELFASPALSFFLREDISKEEFLSNPDVLDRFCQLDDYDITGAIKVWASHEDRVLSILSSSLISRKLFRIKLQSEAFEASTRGEIIEEIKRKYDFNDDEAKYFVIQEQIDNKAYSTAAQNIKIKYKDGSLKDVAMASDHLNLQSLSEVVEKHFLCFPKDLDIKL